MRNLLAVVEEKELPGILEGIEGSFGDVSANPAGAPGIFNKFLSTSVGVMTIIAAIWFLIQFFTGAISIISAEGDKGKIEAARKRITSAIIGIGITVAAIFLIDVIGAIFGLDILNPADFVINL